MLRCAGLVQPAVTDLWLLTLPDQFEPWVQTPALESWPAFSPDGRWVAYRSDAAIIVRSFPDGDPITVVSDARPNWLQWRSGGLYYAREGVPTFVNVTYRPLAFGLPKPAIAGFVADPGNQSFEFSADGRILSIAGARTSGWPTQLNIVLNWLEEVKEKARSTNSKANR